MDKVGQNETVCSPGENVKKVSVAAEAVRAVLGDRQEHYGPPLVNFRRIAAFWNIYLGGKSENYDIQPRDVAIMMILLKAARHMEVPLRDNLVDICGYALCAELIDSQDKPRPLFPAPGTHE